MAETQKRDLDTLLEEFQDVFFKVGSVRQIYYARSKKPSYNFIIQSLAARAKVFQENS